MHLSLMMSLYMEAHLRAHSSENMHFFILAFLQAIFIGFRLQSFLFP